MIGRTKQLVKAMIPRSLCITRLKPGAKDTVLLTFDDGPHPTTTPAVLDLLRRYEARAIFFVVGSRIHQAPEMLSRILDEGHWLGNHTYSHPLERRVTYREYLTDLRKCQEIIFDLTDSRPQFHRPPGGTLSVATLFAPLRCELATMNWSRSAEDWRFRSATAALERTATMATQVASRDVLLFHDERQESVVALEHLLPVLKSRGFELAPELSQIV